MFMCDMRALSVVHIWLLSESTIKPSNPPVVCGLLFLLLFLAAADTQLMCQEQPLGTHICIASADEP